MFSTTSTPISHLQNLLREFKDSILEDRYDEALLQETVFEVFNYFNETPMSRKEAAAFLNISLPTFDKLRKRGLVIEHFSGLRKKWARSHYLRSELVLSRNQPLSGHLGHQEA